jgi:hypothetical protein
LPGYPLLHSAPDAFFLENAGAAAGPCILRKPVSHFLISIKVENGHLGRVTKRRG